MGIVPLRAFTLNVYILQRKKKKKKKKKDWRGGCGVSKMKIK